MLELCVERRYVGGVVMVMETVELWMYTHIVQCDCTAVVNYDTAETRAEI